MTEPRLNLDYVVYVTKRGDTFELAIPELLLFLECSDLQEGYERLQRRKLEIVDKARAMGLLDELPSPLSPPVIKSPSPKKMNVPGSAEAP